MRAMRAAKQKPNDACACGSGAKHKKCCGTAQKLAAAEAARRLSRGDADEDEALSQLTGAQRAARTQHLETVNEALEAERAGDIRRAAKLCALSLPMLLPLGPAGTLDLVTALIFQLEYLSKLEQLAASIDCAERALAVLLPPHSFYPAALATLSHAAWRDTPLDATDARVTLALERVAPVARKMLAVLYTGLGCVFSRGMRSAKAIEQFEKALDALALEPLGPARDMKESSIQARARVVRMRQPWFGAGTAA